MVIWFTGLSGSGKTTLAHELEFNLQNMGYHTCMLDGDKLREGLNKDLGFSYADRVECIRRVSELAKLMSDSGLIVLCAFISPFERDRRLAREIVGGHNFIEVYVNTPLAVCEQRDTKDLYKKARNGEIMNFTGISSPYEPPKSPDFLVDTSQVSLDHAIKELTIVFKKYYKP